jgi:hypothetical protein
MFMEPSLFQILANITDVICKWQINLQVTWQLAPVLVYKASKHTAICVNAAVVATVNNNHHKSTSLIWTETIINLPVCRKVTRKEWTTHSV